MLMKKLSYKLRLPGSGSPSRHLTWSCLRLSHGRPWLLLALPLRLPWHGVFSSRIWLRLSTNVELSKYYYNSTIYIFNVCY